MKKITTFCVLALGLASFVRAADVVLPDGMEILKNYDYPGNVRELENILERSAVLAAAKNAYVITKEDLWTYGGIKDHLSEKADAGAGIFNFEENKDQISSEYIEPIWREPEQHSGSSIEEVEEKAIRKAIQYAEGNVTSASKRLGISRNTLYRKMKIYGIDYKKS